MTANFKKIAVAVLSTPACGLAVGFLASSPASATTTSATTMTTTADVVASCQINSAPALQMTGLTYGATGTTTGNIQVTCTNGTIYNVLLDAGAGAGATTAARVMKGAASGNTNVLTYSLFQDAAYTLNWGNTVGTDTLASTGTGAIQNLPVYAKILSGLQNAPVDTYTDTVNVTVSY